MDSIEKDDTLEFRLNSWMENAAICGLVNILEEDEDKIEIKPQSIVVKRSI